MERHQLSPSESDFYYSTSTISYWIPLFQEESYFNVIIQSLKYCQSHKGLILHGYVIMPTHLHLITSQKPGCGLSAVMRDFKHYTSSKMIELLHLDRHHYYLSLFEKVAQRNINKQRFKVWQEGFHPVLLNSEKWFYEKLNYLHENPVRKGFVEKPEYWKYSSARNWVYGDHEVFRVELLDSLGGVV